jgi:hypothetical protein
VSALPDARAREAASEILISRLVQLEHVWHARRMRPSAVTTDDGSPKAQSSYGIDICWGRINGAHDLNRHIASEIDSTRPMLEQRR